VARADYLFRDIYIGSPFFGHADKDTFARNVFLRNIFTGNAFFRNTALANAALVIIILALTRSLNALFWSRLASRIFYGI
jgi:hypothetical protein